MAVGSFFMVAGGRGGVKMLAAIAGWCWKIKKKKHWLKRPETVPQNLIFKFIFLKIFFRTWNFFIFVHTFQWTSSDFFFNFRFFSRKSQSQEKLPKKITHFTIQFHSKNLTHFMNLNSLDIDMICSCNTAKKPIWIYKQFSSKHVSVWWKKKHLHSTVSWRQKLHSWSTLKANVPLFLY